MGADDADGQAALARQLQRLVHALELLVRRLHLQMQQADMHCADTVPMRTMKLLQHQSRLASCSYRRLQFRVAMSYHARTLLVRLLPLRSRPPLPVYRNHSPSSLSSSYLIKVVVCRAHPPH